MKNVLLHTSKKAAKSWNCIFGFWDGGDYVVGAGKVGDPIVPFMAAVVL